MDYIENIRANRENLDFLSPLKLVKLLTTDKFYHKLPLYIIPPIGDATMIRFKGYYVNPDKSIDIYGTDKVGFSLELFWQNLVILDIYGRPRCFLEKFHNPDFPEKANTWFRPRIYGPGQGVSYGKDIHILMPVYYEDIKAGDTRFISENDNAQVTIVSITKGDNGMDMIEIHMINQFGELVTETYEQKALEDYGDWFYTIINI